MLIVLIICFSILAFILGGAKGWECCSNNVRDRLKDGQRPYVDGRDTVQWAEGEEK